MPTINALLSMQKALQTKRSQLIEIRPYSATTKTSKTISNGTEHIDIVAPEYNLKKIDARIDEITRILFNIDVKIKESNAKTNVDVDFDFDRLVGSID